MKPIPPVVALVLLLAIGIASAAAPDLSAGLLNLVGLVHPFWQLSVVFLLVLSAVVYALGQFFGAETRARATVYATSLFTGAILATVIYLVFLAFTQQDFIINVLRALFPGMGRRVFVAPYIAMSLSFSLAMVIGFYLLAAFFQHPPLDALKQEELAAFLLSIIIVFSWVFLDASMSNVTRSLLCASTPDLCTRIASGSPDGMVLLPTVGSSTLTHVDIAYYSLEILFVKLRSIYVNLYLFEVLIGFLSTISFPIGSLLPGISIISVSFMPFDGLVLLSNAHTIVVEAIGYSMMVIIAKQYLLVFSRDAIPAVLLPIGLMMRAFPWYRMTGSSLIAICVVAYFVFPLSVLLSNYLIFDAYRPANFAYAPDITSYTAHELTPSEIEELVLDRNQEAQRMLQVFDSGSSIAEQVEESCGTGVLKLLCELENVLGGLANSIGGFFHTVGEIFLVMWSFGGDFVSSMLGRAGPIGPSGGMYNFIMLEVVGVSQFVVVVLFSSVLEIIITITMYRNIASLIGGEIEIAGLSKLV